MPLDVTRIREQFPALAVEDRGRPRVYFDNPAGTQVPRQVIDRTVDCFVRANANLGGHFASSILAGEIVDEAHHAMAGFLNAASPDEIVFGQNMTSLTLHVSRSIARELGPGDEIVVTRMDHDANVAPWLLVARDRGCEVRWLDFDPATFEYDLSSLDDVLTDRTRLVAVNYASNLTGTINDVRAVTARARDVGALVYVDAVQFAPHGLLDVQDIGCDFLVCSAYKFFGPHQGILWGRRDVLERLEPYKVRPAGDAIPHRFETGTLSHEGMAGTTGAVEYFAWVGAAMGAEVEARDGEPGRRRNLRAAMDAISEYENALTRMLLDGLETLPGVTVRGITEPEAACRRVPTVSFTHEALAPSEISATLARENVFVWDGHNYAVEVVRRLGLWERGGVVRVGLAHYNTAEEVALLLESVARLTRA
jgi:cysteine desulfurase family protein (TIGR01976 family)